MIRKILGAALMTTALMTGVAQAKDTIVWWDFLSGGDGVRMKAMLDEFNKEHADTVEIQATTLEWGVPFYTKVQTSAAVGQGPDVMTYHESRMPLGVSTGSLSVITPAELEASGIKAQRLRPRQLEGGARAGRQAIRRSPRIFIRSSSTTTRRCCRRPGCSATTASPRGWTA